MRTFLLLVVLTSLAVPLNAAPTQEILPPAPILPPDPFPIIEVPEPKFLDVIIHNMNTDSPDFRTLRVSNSRLDVNEVQLRMAEHVRRKLFEITSVVATRSSYHVICTTRLSSKQLNEGSKCGFFPCVW